jgi:hypothetical protein
MQIDPASPPLGLAQQNLVIQSLVDEMQKKAEDRPSVRVCENGACHLPVFELEEVRKMVLGA